MLRRKDFILSFRKLQLIWNTILVSYIICTLLKILTPILVKMHKVSKKLITKVVLRSPTRILAQYEWKTNLISEFITLKIIRYTEMHCQRLKYMQYSVPYFYCYTFQYFHFSRCYYQENKQIKYTMQDSTDDIYREVFLLGKLQLYTIATITYNFLL